MMSRNLIVNGGYDDGYSSCPCLWGKVPGSLVLRFIDNVPLSDLRSRKVLDLGCGEGKNSFPFYDRGASVTAVDCSNQAVRNGQAVAEGRNINWVVADAETYLKTCDEFDIIVLYGLLHCLANASSIERVVDLALQKTSISGHHIVAAFNDGPHDLSAHPNFSPTLIPDQRYLDLYSGHQIAYHSNAMLHETHPHNNIPHFHSLTRMLVRKADVMSG